MLIDQRHGIEEILAKTASELDVPDHAYEDAVLKYEGVGAWLAAEDSELRPHAPEIYPQGSFRLGTVVRPLDRCDYDIDLVCTLNLTKEQTTQKNLKSMVGDRLKKNPDLQQLISPSRRCWLLDYPSEPNRLGFHMDVLPSLPNPERLPTGILLTDTDLILWQKSNPKAYAEWFHGRMKVILMERRAALAKAGNISIEEVPEWQVKTPLQISIQILKRHRDLYFRSNPDNRPPSIILTTLAAKAYRNQPNIYEALVAITRDMANFLEYKNSRWCVTNPVEPDENFADKWNEFPERLDTFMRWLAKVQTDFSRMSQRRSLEEAVEDLRGPIGNDVMTKVASDLGLRSSVKLARTIPALTVAPLADARHQKEIPWPLLQKHYRATVTGSVHYRKYGKKLWEFGGRIVPKNIWLKFSLQTDVPPPYNVSWQVVNTGEEASSARQLRGDFYEGEHNASIVRWEVTKFHGTHWVEAFVIKNGGCVARSGRVYVRIR